ncbi:MAG: hypothetical protein GY696_15180 [Gammaproteobacteria bacterium]|nr:hypothetical protein [Gammaproteobacteria bacterium]
MSCEGEAQRVQEAERQRSQGPQATQRKWILTNLAMKLCDQTTAHTMGGGGNPCPKKGPTPRKF